MNFLRSFLDNDSVFGQLMTRCGTIIVANLMFLLFSVPVVTIGASWTALHYTMMKMLREKEINPFKAFWHSFWSNWKQSTLVFVAGLAIIGVLVLELYWCRQFAGIPSLFIYGLYAMIVAVAVLCIYLFPVIAAFNGNLKSHIKESLFFAFSRPLDLILILFAHVVPMVATYMDLQRLALYAFLWFFMGFAAVVTFTDSLLLKQFNPFLDETREDAPQKTEREILEEMKKLDF